MELETKDARAVEATLAELLELGGNDLLSVVLCGEAATASYRPRLSPLSLAAVFTRVDASTLHRLAPRMRAWHRRRVAVPLLFDASYLRSALDVFPLELLDLADRHRLLHGEDLFTTPLLDLSHLRLEVEEQLRGKLLHLWQAYLDAAGDRRATRALLADSAAAFHVILRGLLRLRDAARPASAAALLAEVEKTFAVELPVLKRLESERDGTADAGRTPIETTFERYLDEVRALVALVDGL